MGNKKPCPHGSLLPRGLRCVRGYLTIHLKGPRYFRSCRAHTKESERTAVMLLNRVLERRALGVYELPQRMDRMKFKDVAWLWHERHYANYKDPQTLKPRSTTSIESAKYVVGKLVDYFGDYYFDEVEPTHIEAYRDKLVEFDDLSPATFNREKGYLSSIYSMMERWIELKRIDPIKMPKKNPCQFVEDLKETPRDRVASMEELKRLKDACFTLHDPDLWGIILRELETTLRLGDLKRVQDAKHDGDTMTLTQGKTGFEIHLPSMPATKRGQVFVNFRLRWEAARKQATLCDLQFRDLRRTGAHMLKKLGYSAALIKDTLGHKKESTTETYLNYKDAEAIRPLIDARRKLLDTI